MAEPEVKILSVDLDSEKVYTTVEFWESTDIHPARATIGVWIENTDSRSELQARAVAAARAFLKRAEFAKLEKQSG